MYLNKNKLTLLIMQGVLKIHGATTVNSIATLSSREKGFSLTILSIDDQYHLTPSFTPGIK